MQIISARQLSKRSKGEATVTFGPEHARGVGVTVRTRFKHCHTLAGVEVGCLCLCIVLKDGRAAMTLLAALSC